MESVKAGVGPASLQLEDVESFSTGDQNFSLQLTRIAQSNPDLLYVAAMTNEAALIISQARAGHHAFDAGRIGIDGNAYTHIAVSQLVELGLSRTFQHIRLFDSLDARQHLVLARHNLAASRRGKALTQSGAALPDPNHLLARVGLAAKAH